MGLELEDGRMLYMTPDHEVLSVRRTQSAIPERGVEKFYAAGDLTLEDYVVCSAIEGVRDDEELQNDLSTSNWGILDWKLSCERDRNRILAFSRLCGAMHTGRSLERPADALHTVHFSVSNALEASMIADDIGLVTGEDIKTHGLRVEVSERLFKLLRKVGIDLESKFARPSSIHLPTFINHQTPRSVLREFFAAWWGQEGSRPYITANGQLNTNCVLHLSARVGEGHEECTSFDKPTIEIVQTLFRSLLLRDMKHNHEAQRHHSTATETNLAIASEDILRFVEQIGVRYSIDKLRWFNATATYIRTISGYTSSPERSLIRIDETCSESVIQFFERINFDHQSNATVANSRLSFNLSIKRIFDPAIVGKRHVYDIQVPGNVSFVANGIVVHNCGGQDAFMETYLESQRDHIFRNVEVLIYVFDIESRELKKDLTYYHDCLEAIMQNSKAAKVFCLIHKMDLIPEDQRERVFRKKEAELKRLSHPMPITCFKTSIWDETLYKAWSSIVYSLIPNVKTIEANLDNFTQICGADEVVLFERATFLVIAHSTSKEHHDVHRFEKISNIIKQFKLSCMKSSAQFQSMEVQNASFSAYIEGFTPNTYVMVVASDETIQSATVLLNIKAARRHFGNFLNAATNAGAVL